ncbi:MAG TPA: hypothetical protein VKL22_04680 [Actinomycetota bacterium]|nr:hypothetical protein [Actinomycetota bacterium]
MDGSVVAIAAASLLATRAGEGFAGEAGKSAWGTAKRLSGLVRRRFAGDSEAAAALYNLAELEALVVAAERDRSTAKALTQISGSARVGKVATFGDVQGDVSF